MEGRAGEELGEDGCGLAGMVVVRKDWVYDMLLKRKDVVCRQKGRRKAEHSHSSLRLRHGG